MGELLAYQDHFQSDEDSDYFLFVSI